MASLVKRPNGIWYVVYNDANGDQKWVKGYDDKTETQKLAHKLEHEKTAIQRGDIDPHHAQLKIERAKPISEHLKDYKIYLQAKGVSANYLDYSGKDVQALIDFGNLQHAAEITPNLIDKWVLVLKGPDPEQRLDSARTINRRVGCVKSFLRWLHDQGALAHYVLMRYPKQREEGARVRLMRAFSKAEAEALISNAPVERRGVYKFALRTGFRFSEIASITPANLDVAHRTITVKAADAKNKARDQVIPMHSSLVADVKKWTKGKAPDAKVFRMPPKAEAARLLRDDCKALKIDTKDVKFHGLRHTYITRLAESNIHPKILQTLARHSSLETTLRYYVHFKQADERAGIEFA